MIKFLLIILLKQPIEYQKFVGKLIYHTITRFDISFVVHIPSQFMHALKVSHLKATFRVLRYLKDCPYKDMHFKCDNDLSIRAYCDSDWTSFSMTRKPVTEFCIFVGPNLVFYKSEK